MVHARITAEVVTILNGGCVVMGNSRYQLFARKDFNAMSEAIIAHSMIPLKSDTRNSLCSPVRSYIILN